MTDSLQLLVFLVRVGNNSFGTAMRLTYGLAIALWLSLPAAGMASQQQEPAADSENSAGKVPPATEITPDARSKASEGVATKKTNVSTSTNPKRRKRAAPFRDGSPRRIVVREGGASEPAAQIAPDMTPAEAVSQRQNAERLLGSADNQLKLLAGRTLDPPQQETVGQIRNYMGGARSALQEGDLWRANTLAQKAHLLADDLVKH